MAFGIPGFGAFVGPNLTPDKETGLGGWTDQQVVDAFTMGKRPDGRALAGVMPFEALSHLTPADAQAIVAFLRSVPPVANKVPGPFGPADKPTVAVSVIGAAGRLLGGRGAKKIATRAGTAAAS